MSEPKKHAYNSKQFLIKGPEINGTLAESAAHYFPDIEFRPISSLPELEEASHLVYQEYVQSGYIKPNANGWKLTLFQLLPTTVTFIAKHKKHGILSTLTLVEDSPLGLPMEGMYKLELNDLRYGGHHLAEFSMFAADKEKFADPALSMSNSQRLILNCHLFRSLFDYLRVKTNVTTMVECCHPTHDGFYKLMSLEPLGKINFHRGVQGNPAVARFLDLRKAFHDGPEKNTSARLYLRELPPENTFDSRFKYGSNEIEKYFVEHSNILSSASPHQFQFLQTQYPEVDLQSLVKKKDLFSYLVESLEKNLGIH